MAQVRCSWRCLNQIKLRMALTLRGTHQVAVSGNTVINSANVDGPNWNSNALFDVDDASGFSFEVGAVGREALVSDEDGGLPFMMGIFPSDANLAGVDIENVGGAFVELHDDPDAHEYMLNLWQNGRYETVPGFRWERGSIFRLCLIYKDRKLYFAANQGTCKPVMLQESLSGETYLPCLTIKSPGAKFSIWIDRPSNKRKACGDSTLPSKVPKSLWSSRDFSDAKIVCGSTTIPVHRCILSAASPFFDRAFKCSMREASEAVEQGGWCRVGLGMLRGRGIP